jgi:thioredoxin-related protein
MKQTILKSAIAVLIMIFAVQASEAQKPGGVKWYTIEEAEKLAKELPRPIFVDTYTDWCSWCKKLDNETFAHPVIVDILNTKYYAVKFNAEGKEEVTFKGMKFKNDGKYGRAHQLAVALLQGKMGYPTVVFLNENADLVTSIAGFRGPKDMEPVLIYFAEKVYLTRTLEDYTANFKGTIK